MPAMDAFSKSSCPHPRPSESERLALHSLRWRECAPGVDWSRENCYRQDGFISSIAVVIRSYRIARRRQSARVVGESADRPISRNLIAQLRYSTISSKIPTDPAPFTSRVLLHPLVNVVLKPPAKNITVIGLAHFHALLTHPAAASMKSSLPRDDILRPSANRTRNGTGAMTAHGTNGMTLLELLLVGIGVLLALIAMGLRFAVRELREIKLHLAAERAHREGRAHG